MNLEPTLEAPGSAYAVVVNERVTHLFADAHGAELFTSENGGDIVVYPIRTIEDGVRMFDRRVVVVDGAVVSDRTTTSWHFADDDPESVASYDRSSRRRT
jgi:hypothetical protein